MLPLFSLLCCIAPVVLGVPLSKENYGLINDINPEYEDLDAFPFAKAPIPAERGQKYGYLGETHEVVTEDGHILQMHRLVGSKRSPIASNKPPVLLVHGLMDCSATWVMGIPEKSLGYILADWGYDVWLGNVRGNRYSRKHKWMTTKDEKYWMFSWHEIGIYDLPAMIDHILEVSKQKKLMYVGHSQGGTAFLVMASERPEYQEKIEAAFPLAPASFMEKATNPALRILAPLVKDLKKLTDLIGMYEIKPTSEFIQKVAKLACQDEAITSELCTNIIFLVGGPSYRQLNRTLIPEVAQYDPAGAAVRQFVHYAQLINSGGFVQYDHGLLGNLRVYGQARPPKYNVANIKIPVYIFYSSKDQLVNEQDIRKLYMELPNAQKFMVPLKDFSHLDFVWGKDVDTLLYNRVLSRMEVHRGNI
ncbi:lipase 3 [Nomia melanderi]|uniref:lipase 3 n=1 Tax=Nomia melanderi TaxID=2448451 RepID=UPI0013046A45|nr:lipase 3-like [Nomia melanderi]